MIDAYVEVTLEIDPARLAGMSDDLASRYVLERLRHAVDSKCDAAGARLRTDRQPEIIVKRAADRLTHADVLLVAARFAAEVPEGTEWGPPA